jgi:hypothetical protein
MVDFLWLRVKPAWLVGTNSPPVQPDLQLRFSRFSRAHMRGHSMRRRAIHVIETTSFERLI